MITSKPKVSIVIPFYNCPYIGRAIESALNQTYPNCQIIVIDDGSTMYLDRITPYRTNIQYVRKENGGTATALNLGIRIAKGNYFTWLSSDDLYLPGKVEKQLNFMNAHKADICYGNYSLIDEQANVLTKSVGVGITDRWQFLRTMRSGCIINGCTVMAKTKIIKDAGMFDETLPYTHDYDLWLRLLPNYPFHYFEEPLVHYRIHDNMGSQKYKQAIRNEIQTVKRKHRDTISRLVNMYSPRRRSRYFPGR